MTYNDWPRLSDEHLTSAELESYAQRILDKTGKEPILDLEGKYYEIDYPKIESYIKIPDDMGNYILQNPVGDIMYLSDLTEEGKSYFESDDNSNKGLYTPDEIKNLISQGYIKVATVNDLNNVRNNLSGKYIQVKDIDLSSNTNWVSIGDNSSSFSGIYDGGGYEISNLTIDRPEEDNIGLFGSVEGAKIENINLIDVDVIASKNSGALMGIGDANTSIHNVYSSGQVTADIGYAGGIVGTFSGVLDSCFSSSSITTGYGAGGISGALLGEISNSYFIGNIKHIGDYGSARIGGIVGYGAYGSINNSYSIGNIAQINASVTNRYRGGLLGFTYDTTLNNSYSINTLTIRGGYNKSRNAIIVNSNALSEAWLKQQSSYKDWDFNTIWEIKEGQSYPTLQWQNK